MELWIKEYIFKVAISFISINAVIFIFADNFKKIKNIKHNGFINRNFKRLLPCLIPVFRWVWITLIIIIGLALSSEELVNKINKD